MHRFKILNFKSMLQICRHCVIFCRRRCPHRPAVPTTPYATRNHAVGAPVLGRPDPADFDGICVITIISPLGSACVGRLGRGVPTDSNEHLPTTAAPRPPFKGEQKGVACRQCVPYRSGDSRIARRRHPRQRTALKPPLCNGPGRPLLPFRAIHLQGGGSPKGETEGLPEKVSYLFGFYWKCKLFMLQSPSHFVSQDTK